jgi:hypothetical protein
MNTMKICSGCQKPLEANAPDGLCPECLLKAGLGTGVDIGPDGTARVKAGEPHSSPPYRRRLPARFRNLGSHAPTAGAASSNSSHSTPAQVGHGRWRVLPGSSGNMRSAYGPSGPESAFRSGVPARVGSGIDRPPAGRSAIE